jgi:hypothetical protein
MKFFKFLNNNLGKSLTLFNANTSSLRITLNKYNKKFRYEIRGMIYEILLYFKTSKAKKEYLTAFLFTNFMFYFYVLSQEEDKFRVELQQYSEALKLCETLRTEDYYPEDKVSSDIKRMQYSYSFSFY